MTTATPSRLLAILVLAMIGCSQQPPNPPPANNAAAGAAPQAPLAQPKEVPDAPKPGEWRKIAFPPAASQGFSVAVEMPGEPQRSSNEDQMRDQKVRSETCTVRGPGGVEYSAIVASIPGDEPLDVEKVLDGVVTGLVGSPNGKLLEEHHIAHDEHRGRQVKIGHPRATIWARVYLIDRTLVQLIATSASDQVDGQDVERFLGSLRLYAAM